ncbi:acetoacetate metabolism regulatory protein AtoC [Roseisolibacter agri]|uniref:Acetoacetate metabolism regulatory protein AtoC n=1 Tax=Roseisolibacter agri TaxID=2014610 RepID=A0AA37QJH1_9BACT|nr:acetoacetate metabolism regulatory protein AtoC [Roseisolibacter agri]
MGAAARGPVRVLVAEDEAHLGTLLEQFLVGRGHDVTLVRDGKAALAALRERDFDVALTDVQMPGLDGLALLAAARALPLAPEVIVVTGNGAAETQLRALRQGAYDAVAKPYRMAEIDLLVHRAAEKRAMRRALAATSVADVPVPRFVTTDAALADAVARAESAAASGAPLLLIGEPGTGKRTLARWLHAHAGRSGPFVDADPRAMPADERVARLHGRAVDAEGGPAVPSLSQLAAGGTLLLRGVETVEPRVLEQLVAAAAAPAGGHALVGTVERVAMGQEAVLRAPFGDAVVGLPPLRARPGDVTVVAEQLASRRAGAPVTLTTDARTMLEARSWPGNAAELAAVVAAAAARLAWGETELPLAAFER